MLLISSIGVLCVTIGTLSYVGYVLRLSVFNRQVTCYFVSRCYRLQDFNWDSLNSKVKVEIPGAFLFHTCSATTHRHVMLGN